MLLSFFGETFDWMSELLAIFSISSDVGMLIGLSSKVRICMNNGLTYSKAKEIIEKIESLSEIENTDVEQVTEQIG